MGTTYTPADWVSRDDMAVLMRKSTCTVGRLVKKHDLETRTADGGRVLVNVGDFLRLGEIRPEDLTTGATPAESAAMVRSRHAEATLREQAARLEGKLAQAEVVVETLREQLAAKDKQIAKRDDQITQLTGLLGRFAAMGGAA